MSTIDYVANMKTNLLHRCLFSAALLGAGVAPAFATDETSAPIGASEHFEHALPALGAVTELSLRINYDFKLADRRINTDVNKFAHRFIPIGEVSVTHKDIRWTLRF